VVFDSDKGEVICKKTGKVVLTFKRRGGLYTADLVLKAPRKKEGHTAKPTGFGGHGRR